MTELSSDRLFRLKILACTLSPKVMSSYGPILLPQYFEQQDEHDVLSSIREYWSIYRKPPPQEDLKDMLKGSYLDLLDALYRGVKEWDLSYAADRMVQFCQEQAAMLAVLESLSDVESGDLAKVVERLKEAMKIGRDIGYRGINVNDPSEWLPFIEMEKIPTGIVHLDLCLDGGLAKGELGVFLAPPNYGKSMALINVGFGAAGPISQSNVAHFSFEMNDDVIAKRYGARLLFRFPNRHGDNELYEKNFRRYARYLLPGKIRAFRVTGDVNVLRYHLDRLIDEGFIPDLIIVDYGDEVEAKRHYTDHWVEAGSVFKDLRDLGYDYECPVWTATQANRSALGREIITMKEIAESIKKAAIADVIVAICQTWEEEKNEQARLFLAKIRDGRARRMLRAKYYTPEQALITTGFVTDKENLYSHLDEKEE